MSLYQTGWAETDGCLSGDKPQHYLGGGGASQEGGSFENTVCEKFSLVVQSRQ